MENFAYSIITCEYKINRHSPYHIHEGLYFDTILFVNEYYHFYIFQQVLFSIKIAFSSELSLSLYLNPPIRDTAPSTHKKIM